MARRKAKKVIESNEADLIVNRIAECQTVINEIDNSPLWRIVLKDMEGQRKFLDDAWQEITDSEKLQKARELKFATLHILRLKQKYEEELNARREDLRKYENIKTEVIKDYDLDTNMEKK